MRYSEIATGGAFVALGATMVAIAGQLKPIAHSDFGPGFFPGIVGAGMIVLGALAVVSVVLRRSPSPEPDYPPVLRVERPTLFYAYLAAPLLYAVLAPVLGFLIVTPFLVGGLVFLASRKPARSIIADILVTLAIHILFYTGLRVSLPWGVLTPFAGVLTWR